MLACVGYIFRNTLLNRLNVWFLIITPVPIIRIKLMLNPRLILSQKLLELTLMRPLWLLVRRGRLQVANLGNLLTVELLISAVRAYSCEKVVSRCLRGAMRILQRIKLW